MAANASTQVSWEHQSWRKIHSGPGFKPDLPRAVTLRFEQTQIDQLDEEQALIDQLRENPLGGVSFCEGKI